MAPDDQTVSAEATGIGCLMFGTLYGQAIADSDAARCRAKGTAAVCVFTIIVVTRSFTWKSRLRQVKRKPSISS